MHSNNVSMTPKELVTALILKPEKEGLRLLQTYLQTCDEALLALLVETIKREADRQWNNNAALSFKLAGFLINTGTLARNKSYHALGLMARGDALRRLDRDQEAIPFLDAAGEEFLAINDEVGWARTRIGRVSACLQLNRTTEALSDAAAAREVFIRHNNFKRAGQIDVNAGIIHFELGQYEQALHLYDRAIETYLLLHDEVDLLIARARGNKALALAALGRFREAIALHEQARATFAAHENEKISV